MPRQRRFHSQAALTLRCLYFTTFPASPPSKLGIPVGTDRAPASKAAGVGPLTRLSLVRSKIQNNTMDWVPHGTTSFRLKTVLDGEVMCSQLVGVKYTLYYEWSCYTVLLSMYLLDNRKCKQLYFGHFLIFLFLGLRNTNIWEPLYCTSFDPIIQVLGNEPPEIMDDVRNNL